MLKALIRWAKITKTGSDTEQFATQQLTYSGKVANTLVVFPYGLHGNATPESLALMFAVEGNTENRAAIAWTAKNRPTLAGGEVALYHPPTGSVLKWDSSGNLIINNGSATIKLAGDTLTVTGNLVVNGTITNNGKDVGDTHKHSQGTDSAGDTQKTINGVL